MLTLHKHRTSFEEKSYKFQSTKLSLSYFLKSSTYMQSTFILEFSWNTFSCRSSLPLPVLGWSWGHPYPPPAPLHSWSLPGSCHDPGQWPWWVVNPSSAFRVKSARSRTFWCGTASDIAQTDHPTGLSSHPYPPSQNPGKIQSQHSINYRHI